MSVYLVNFLVYSMAMVGILFIGIVVYKKTMVQGRFSKDTNNLKVENALNLSQRKTLYVIQAGSEKFLIAADAERTSFLAKLNTSSANTSLQESIVDNEVKVNVDSLPSKPVDYSEVMNAIRNTKYGRKQPVMKEMLRKLSEPIEEKQGI